MKKIILLSVFISGLSFSLDSNGKDVTILINENLFNNLFLEVGDIEKKIKKGKVKISNLDFQFYDEKGELNFDVKFTGKRKVISIKKSVTVDIGLEYDNDEDLIKLEFDKIKINFGKIIGDIDVTKILSLENYEFPAPPMEIAPISIDDKIIRPVILESEATFINDAVKIAYKIGQNSPNAISKTIQTVNNGEGKSMVNALEVEADQFKNIFKSEESREGLSAFLEKRRPDFSKSN